MSVLKIVCVCALLKRGLGEALGVDGGWPLLSTRPQPYCDPASLVFLQRIDALFIFERTKTLVTEIGNWIFESQKGKTDRKINSNVFSST